MKKIRKSKGIDITFFVPCLNEENNIIPTLEIVLSTVKTKNYSYEILIFDDHSKDNTVKQIEDYQVNHKELPIELIRNKKTMGLGHNYFKGAHLGKGKYYIMVCGDNVTPKEFILKVLEKLGSAEIVIPNMNGYDTRPLLRKVISRLYTFIVNFVSGYSMKYYNGGAAHLRKNIISYSHNPSGFGFQAELIIHLLNQGASYVEISAPIIQKKYKIFTKAFTLSNFFSVLYSFWNILLFRFQKFLFRS